MIILKQLEKKNKSIQIFPFVLKDEFPLFIFFTKSAVVNIKRRQNNDVACDFNRAQKFMRKNDSHNACSQRIYNCKNCGIFGW